MKTFMTSFDKGPPVIGSIARVQLVSMTKKRCLRWSKEEEERASEAEVVLY
jgi:hypothetical protein